LYGEGKILVDVLNPEIFGLPGIFLFILGLLLGSFANLLIYRLPKDQPWAWDRSRCKECGTVIKWYDNIPVLSWFLLRGRCRKCKTPYSFRYVIVELLTGVLFSLCYFYYGFSWLTLEYSIFCWMLVVVSFIDFDHMILPDEFTIGGIVIGLIGAALNPERNFMESFIGVVVGGGFLWLLAYFYFVYSKKEGLGGGDIKLIAWIGAILGWKVIPFVITSSAILGSFVGIAVAIKSKEGLKAAIPFGPYLALGALLSIFQGQTLAQHYLSLFLPGLD
jgi:leader peptidase (prepilin peptidase) / N-methyltransferase